MQIKSENIDQTKKKTSALCYFLFEKSTKLLGSTKLPSKLDDVIKDTIKENKGKLCEISVFPTYGHIQAKKIVIAGLGLKEKTTIDTLRIVSGKITQKIRSLGLTEFTIVFPHGAMLDFNLSVYAIVEGAMLSMYSFDKYKKEKETNLPDLTILDSKIHKMKDVIYQAQIGCKGVIFARNIANLPPNDCPPIQLARFAKELASKSNLICKIFSKNELKKRKFGGISAVGKGSKNEPKLIILEYFGNKGQKPIVIVGKAVTFDTGGISLKPSEKMDEMKFDKCGGCTVLGIMKAVSELKLPVNVVGIIPSVENMPGGESYRPGDIIQLYNRKTVEILNTDAEGRLILADALSYGIKQYSPKAIIDFATLTGACIVALGNNVAGVVTNNSSFFEKIKQSSKNTSEEVWQLPLNDDYMEMIKSNVADIKNIGIGRAAGTIIAAAFLANAIDDTPWVHIDIAGTAWTQEATKNKPYNPKGATGFGIRLVLDYLKSK
jgi:leucyl aminopeptidase